MKKISIYVFGIIILLFLIIFLKFQNQIINYLINFDFSNANTIYLYVLLSTCFFVTPLPVTFVIILNGFFFKELGFYISILQIIVGSIILNLFSNKIKNHFNINLEKKMNTRKLDFSKITNSNYSIFISRYLFPYFIHNIYYGLTKVKLFNFITIIFFAELPLTYAISSIGKSLNKITSDYHLTIYSLFSDVNFYIPFLIIFIMFIITNLLIKKK